MDRLSGKVAVITGASAGIGKCVARDLVSAGVIVIGLARRIDLMQAMTSELKNLSGEFHPYQCDVSSLESIKLAFKWIAEKFTKINILINNAGISKHSRILAEGNEEELKQIIDVNLMGSIFCTKATFDLMKNVNDDCTIINMTSVFSRRIPFIDCSLFSYNLYPSSKYALTAAAEVLRQELATCKNFRISNISPGYVKTDIVHAANHPRADRIMKSAKLTPEDVSRTIIFVLECPKHVQISEMIIQPVGQDL